MRQSILLLLTMGLLQQSLNAQDVTPILSSLKGPYLGQTPPGMTAKLFAPGLISTDEAELNSVFSGDGTLFLFTRRQNSGPYTIFNCQRTESGWTTPKKAPFNWQGHDVDMGFAPDGKTLYWCSDRPDTGLEPGPFRFWTTQRAATGWEASRLLPGPINHQAERTLYPTFTTDGILYFKSIRAEGFGGNDIYRSVLKEGTYQSPQNLGPVINTSENEGDVLVAPDESWIIINAFKNDGYGQGDLYISFRQEDGQWNALTNMGAAINSEGTEYCPMLSPDNHYLFFTSTRTGRGDIYWIDARIIDTLRPPRP